MMPTDSAGNRPAGEPAGNGQLLLDFPRIDPEQRPLIETGRLVALFPGRMKARYAHYLVYPERSRQRSGFQAFRSWVLEEAAAFRTAATSADELAAKRALRTAATRLVT